LTQAFASFLRGQLAAPDLRFFRDLGEINGQFPTFPGEFREIFSRSGG